MSEEQGQVDTFLVSLSKLLQDKLREDRQRQRQLERQVAELRSRSQLPQKNQRLVSADDADLGSKLLASLLLAPNLEFTRLVPARKPPAFSNDGDDSDDDEEHPPPLPRRRATPPLPERRHNKTPPLPKRRNNRTPPLPKRKPSVTVKNRSFHRDVDSDEEAPPLPRRRGLMNHVGESTRIESDDDGPPLPRRPSANKPVPPPVKPKRRTPPQEGFPEYDNYVMSPSKADTHPEDGGKSLGVGKPRFKGASLLSQWQPPTLRVVEPPAPPAPRKQPPRLFVDMEREISEQKVTVALVGKSVRRSTADATLIHSSAGSIVLGESDDNLPLKPPKPQRVERVSPVEEKPELISADESNQRAPPIKAPKPKLARSTNPLKLWQPPNQAVAEPPQFSEDDVTVIDVSKPMPEKPVRKGWMNSLSSNTVTERHSQTNVLPPRSPSKLSWMLLLQANTKTERTVQLSTSPVRSPSKLSWMALLNSNSATTAHRQSSQAAIPTSPTRISRSPTRTDWLSLATSKSATPKNFSSDGDAMRSVSRSPTKLSWIDLALSRGADAHHYTDTTKPNFEIKKLGRAKEIVVEEEDKKVPEFLNTKLKRSPEKPSLPPKRKPDEEEVPVVSQLQKLKATKPPPRKPPKPTDNEDEELLASTMEKLGKKKLPPPKAAKPSQADKEPEILAQKLRSLSPSKTDTQSKPKDSKYLEADAAELRLQMLRLGRSNTAKQAPKPQAQPVEAIATLSKLKTAPPVKPKPKETPEALAKLNALKHQQPPTRKLPQEDEEPDFRAQLGNILKRGTPASMGSSDGRRSPSDLTPGGVMSSALINSLQLSIALSSSGLKRSDTSGSGKLLHATKLRAKGPKRRLPKLVTSESLSESAPAKGNTLRKVSTDSKLGKKAPPLPVKKKPAVESRQFSGEVFI